MKVLELSKQADDMTVFPPGKKKIATIAAGLVLLLVGAVLSFGFSSTSEPQGKKIHGDLQNLAVTKPTTGNTIRGAITINQQIPLPRGFVVAYSESMSHAVTACPLRADGNFRLENLPSSPLVLVLKSALNDVPSAKLVERSNQMPGIPDVSDVGGKSHEGKSSSPVKPAELIRIMTAKRPTKEALSRIKCDGAMTPDLAALPEVQWLIEFAFLKYGGEKHGQRKFLVPEGEGERVYMMNLLIP